MERASVTGPTTAKMALVWSAQMLTLTALRHPRAARERAGAAVRGGREAVTEKGIGLSILAGEVRMQRHIGMSLYNLVAMYLSNETV